MGFIQVGVFVSLRSLEFGVTKRDPWLPVVLDKVLGRVL